MPHFLWTRARTTKWPARTQCCRPRLAPIRCEQLFVRHSSRPAGSPSRYSTFVAWCAGCSGPKRIYHAVICPFLLPASEFVAAKSLASIDATLPNEMTSCDAPLL